MRKRGKRAAFAFRLRKNFSANRRAATNAGNFGLLERRKGRIKTESAFSKKEGARDRNFLCFKKSAGCRRFECAAKERYASALY
jgi:hypothetical protein